MSELFYKEILQAKNGSKIPAFTSGKAAHSKYAPEREAQSFLGENHDLLFAAIVGVGGGYHIESFCQRNPQCKVIAVEKTQADLDFLRQNIPSVQKLFQNKKIIFAAADVPGQLEGAIEQNYFPAVEKKKKIAALRPWADEAGADYDKILERAKAALKKISADYSVQARFGGL